MNLETENDGPPVQKRKMNGCLMTTLIVVGVAIFAVGGCFLVGGAAISGMAKEKKDQLKALETAHPSDLPPTGELAEMFNLMSKNTDLQRANKEKELQGKIVAWKLPVYEMRESGKAIRIQTSASNGTIGTFVTIEPKNVAEKTSLQQLNTGDLLSFKGFIDGVSLRHLDIQPAILINVNTLPSKEVSKPENSIKTEAVSGPPSTEKSTQETAVKTDSTMVEIAEIKLPETDASLLAAKGIPDISPSKLMPYSVGLRNPSNVGKIIEWDLIVDEVSSEGVGVYRIDANGLEDIDKFQVEIATNNDEDRKAIESLQRGGVANIKGKIKWNNGHIIIISPAILNKTSSKQTSSLLTNLVAPKEIPIALESITNELNYKESMTALQRESLNIRLEGFNGKIVEGTIHGYSPQPAATSGCSLVSSGGKLITTLQLHFRNDNELAEVKKRVLHKSREPFIGEVNDPEPIPFRGYIDYVSPANHSVDSATINIGPAIFLEHPAYMAEIKAEAEKIVIEQQEVQQKEETLRKQEQDKKQRLANETADREKYFKELAQEEQRRRQLDIDSIMASEEQEAAAGKEARARKGYYVPEAHESQPASSPPAPTPATTTKGMPGECFPQTRLELLGPTELMDLNLAEIRYAINEMYARHGASFQKPELAKVFAAKAWYKPRPGISLQQIEQEFSPVEADNLKLLGKERDNKAAPADLYELVDSESNLREGPGTDYPIVRKSRKGETGEALQSKLGWMKLRFTDGSMAWAHEQNIKSKN